MLTLVLVIVGPLTCAWLLAASRRAAVADRARSLGPRSRWRVPERVRGKLLAHVFSDVVKTKLVKNMHGDSSGVRGAAWLFEPGGKASAYMA